jgi:hypothetical protein
MVEAHMMKSIPQPIPHPFKISIAKAGLRLWQLRRLLPGCPSESKISRMLNGIQPLDADTEAAIGRVVEEAANG